MADLDDFFAKKDKKKSKGKKFLTADDVAKKLDDTSKKTTEPSKVRKERPISGGGVEGEESNNIETQREDEWKDFEEEERKDYSGLKLGQLTLSEEEQQANLGQDDMNNEGSSDGEGNVTNADRKIPGPWKKVVAAEDVTQIPIEPEPQPLTSSTSKSVYTSPAFRNQLSSVKARIRNRTAPDITNEDYFPTLGAARPEEQKKKKNEPAFEEVRHGGRITRVQEIQSAPVSVGNRFKSLADDDS